MLLSRSHAGILLQFFFHALEAHIIAVSSVNKYATYDMENLKTRGTLMRSGQLRIGVFAMLSCTTSASATVKPIVHVVR